MKRIRPGWIALTALAVWAVIALPTLAVQWEQAQLTRASLAGKELPERSSMTDYPAYPVARQIRAAVPPDSCVSVLAYAGPGAVDYYNARFDYLLYPRRVDVFANTSGGDCPYVAVFQDSQQNLAAEPFAGSWDSEALQQRLASMEPVARGSLVTVYRSR